MTRGNPEFTKNVKLEFNMTRFVIPLVLLFLIVWIGWSSEPNMRAYYSQYTDDQLKAKTLYGWLCGFGFLFTILWGTYLVSNSLLEEIKVKTWDFVRMSSLSPMKILIGKLFGATSVIWTVTLLGIVPCMMYSGAVMIPGGGFVRPEAVTLGVLWLCLFFWAVLSYALAMLLGLAADSRTIRGGPFSNTIIIFLIGTVIGGFITEFFGGFFKLHSYVTGNTGPQFVPQGAYAVSANAYITNPSTDLWYGLRFYNFDLLLLLLAFFAAWAFAGAWRALRRSLQYHDAPWVWTAFIIAAALFLNGFELLSDAKAERIRGILYWPIFVSLATLFFACISEAGDVIKYRAFARNLSARARYETFREMPLWMISFVMLLASILLSLPSALRIENAALFLVSIVGFVARDLLAFHTISWTPNVRRPLVGLVVYLAVAYGLLPLLAETVGNKTGYLFFPLLKNESTVAYWGLLAAETVLAASLCRRRWRGVFGPADDQPAKA